jgi:hypothetical protein
MTVNTSNPFVFRYVGVDLNLGNLLQSIGATPTQHGDNLRL